MLSKSLLRTLTRNKQDLFMKSKKDKPLRFVLFLFVDTICAICRGEQCSPVTLIFLLIFFAEILPVFNNVQNNYDVCTSSETSRTPSPTLYMCLRFAQACFDKVENFVLRYAKHG